MNIIICSIIYQHFHSIDLNSKRYSMSPLENRTDLPLQQRPLMEGQKYGYTPLLQRPPGTRVFPSGGEGGRGLKKVILVAPLAYKVKSHEVKTKV